MTIIKFLTIFGKYLFFYLAYENSKKAKNSLFWVENGKKNTLTLILQPRDLVISLTLSGKFLGRGEGTYVEILSEIFVRV